MSLTKIGRQLKIVAVAYAILLLATGILDAFVQIPEFDRLIFHSVMFHIALFCVLWLFAAFFSRNRDD